MNDSTPYDYNLTSVEDLGFQYTGLARILNIALDSEYLKSAITFVWSLLVVFGLFGNGLVIYIALAYRKLNDITNCYIFNLAITDMLFILFCIPFTIYMYTNTNWLFGVTFCKLNHFMSHASVQSTCLTLTAMTIHRCNLIIQNKLQLQNAASASKSRHTVICVTSIIWLVSFLLSSPDLIYYTAVTEFDPEVNETYVSCSIKDTHSIFKYYISISNFVSIGSTYIIPLLVIVLSYGRLLSHLSANQRRLARFKQSIKEESTSKKRSVRGERTEPPKVSDTNGPDYAESQAMANYPLVTPTPATPTLLAVPKKPSSKKKGPSSESRKKKVTTMVAVVTLNFGICWLPTHLFIILKRLILVTPDSNTYVYLTIFKLIAHTLSYLTPVINPVLYAFYNENFLLPLLDIWSRATCRTVAKADASSQRKQAKSAAYP